MKKHMRVASWYAIFLTAIVLSIPAAELPKNSWEDYLRNFSLRLNHYKQTSRHPAVVIIGSSYAYFLDECDKLSNLGLPDLWPNEIESVADKYCRRDDIILYVYTYRDLIGPCKSVRSEVVNDLKRAGLIKRAEMRAEMRHLLGLSQDKSLIPPPKAGLYPYPAMEKEYFWDDVDWFVRAPVNPACLDVFIRLNRKFPHMIFILAPVFPAEALAGYYEEEKIDTFQRKIALCPTVQSGLKIVDCSRYIVDAKLFHDLVHLTPHGNEIFRKHIIELLNITELPEQAR